MFTTSLFLSIALFTMPIHGQQPEIPKSVNTELSESVAHLTEILRAGAIGSVDAPFIKYVTTFSLPEDVKAGETVSLRRKTETQIYSWFNHLHTPESEGLIKLPQKLTDTLYWMDIRWYGWTLESWNAVIKDDPFFRAPWTRYDKHADKPYYIGMLVRADWFITQTGDTTSQEDYGRSPYYYTLLYGQNPPKTRQEFIAKWQIDYDKIERNNLWQGSLLDRKDSGIARHNRLMYRSRTELGYFWETFDVKQMEGNRNFIEVLPPLNKDFEFDANEQIATNKVGLQVYQLNNGKNKKNEVENRIQSADNGIVGDHTDPEDRRIRTPKSCVICHPTGINQTKNSYKAIAKSGVKLKTLTYHDEALIARRFLGEINEYVKEDQNSFERAVKQCNGLDGDTNAKYFADLYDWYREPLDIKQAAREVGVSVGELKLALSQGAKIRTGYLIKGGKIPRENWDDPNSGDFAISMLLLMVKDKVLATLEAPTDHQAKASETDQRVLNPPVFIQPLKDTNVMSGADVVGVAKAGAMMLSREIMGADWYVVEIGDKKGVLNKADVKIVE